MFFDIARAEDANIMICIEGDGRFLFDQIQKGRTCRMTINRSRYFNIWKREKDVYYEKNE